MKTVIKNRQSRVVNQKTLEIIATAFCNGKKHDFKLFKETYAGIDKEIICLADSGHQGLTKIHTNSETPAKKSKKHPLTDEQKKKNRALSQKRIYCEHVIGKLKIFRILKERYRNRRKRFGLRFNLISALYSLSLVTR
ncbi:Mobile element protein [hydrothermal vent metagenome]|uniref:Mobile element protein n=1 Tax=hydrothermal vent metagenome TaxID=652676 RepID=A0A3B0VI50_9ZZZZ